ncbi:MAG: response regulator transcription factor [Nitrospirota bacterium]
MGKRIVVVEDEEKVVSLIRAVLSREGFDIKSAPDGISGLTLVQEEIPDLLILDLMLPSLDGFEICREIRMDPRTAQIPVIILTCKSEELDKVLGLELGADDFITKPFSPRELLARVKAVLRRTGQNKEIHVRLFYKNLIIDTSAYTVKDGERDVELTPKEFGLLAHLVRNKGRVLTRHAILGSVWGLPGDITTRTVDTHIRGLRKKMPVLAESILTVKQFGYKLKDED